MRRPVVALALALLLVLAGCNAPTGPPAAPTASGATTVEGPTTTAEPTTTESVESTGWAGADGMTVKNGTLPVNGSLIFARVATLLATNASPPQTIDIRSDASMTTQARGLPAFAVVMGIDDGRTGSRDVTAAGITSGSNYVALNARLLADPDRTRGVLVHEFVHVVQYQHGSIDTAYENIQPGSTDSQMAYLAVVEGIPVYVEERYAHAYGDGDPTGMDELVAAYNRSSGVHKYALAPYAFGAQYADARVESAAAVEQLYETPPTTSETVIHGLDPGTEPIRRLETDVEGGTWRWSDRDRLGELFVRQVLTTELDEDRAATAAAGWGVDRQLTFTNGSADAYVWALRWDSVRDADEFEAATREYLDDRGTMTDGVWRTDDASFRLVRTSPEVVVIVVGPSGFVGETTVSGTNESVAVDASAA